VPLSAAFALAEPLESSPSSNEWVRFLEGLEGQLDEMRDCTVDPARLLEMSNTKWLPPVGLGEMPVELAPRAAALLEEMDALRPKLQKSREETVRQLRAVESIPRETGLTSVYLDSVG
jgi:hypothetical protein